MTDTLTHSARRADIESWLDSLNARWTFNPDLVLAKVDQDSSLANQARRIPLNDTVVERYALDMARGDQFPPLLVHDVDPPLLLGGNHRFAAHLTVGNTTAPAYLIKAKAQTLHRIRFEDNARHGLPPTNQERIVHAVGLVRLGMSQHAAAAVAGLPQPKPSIALAVADMTDRAARLGVNPRVNALPDSTRYSLARCSHDQVFTELAAVTIDAGLPKAVVDDLVRAANATEPVEALRIVALTADEYADRARDMAGNVRRSSRTARATLEASLAVIRGLDPAEVDRSCPNDDVRAVLAQRILDAAKILQRSHAILVRKDGDQ